ncbi:Cell wall galactomannoprotein [Cordyceps fumosorosea ARSEF 2679]|uniref:Cell wall galactomannoprotein n=1 Tax=Cordyceps fumosorosea (strain ARSEF 2679) TaxID=1081104 RepID=A0A167QP52_CORFA|nr:Cell wall galactomannoprotein [Cordyceps fumosorosea ARSEF 2679]OAA57819.1 Cell wall galactomannoprotein [Cordyceps fumosorosea ARSEF 2679]
MHFTMLISLFLVAPAISHLAPRDNSTGIVGSISAISGQLAAMNATLDRIRGPDDAQAAVDFQNQATQLRADLTAATDSVRGSAALDDDASASVAYAVVGITDVTYAVLGKVVAKHDVFDGLGGGGAITGLVREELQELQNSTLGFGEALTDKFVTQVRNVAPLLLSSLEFHFYETIQAYA